MSIVLFPCRHCRYQGFDPINQFNPTTYCACLDFYQSLPLPFLYSYYCVQIYYKHDLFNFLIFKVIRYLLIRSFNGCGRHIVTCYGIWQARISKRKSGKENAIVLNYKFIIHNHAWRDWCLTYKSYYSHLYTSYLQIHIIDSFVMSLHGFIY